MMKDKKQKEVTLLRGNFFKLIDLFNQMFYSPKNALR